MPCARTGLKILYIPRAKSHFVSRAFFNLTSPFNRIRPSKCILRPLRYLRNFAENEDMKKGETESKRPRMDAESWGLLLQAHESSSDLSVKDFCTSRGIGIASYYHWRNRLRVDKASERNLFSPIEIQTKPSGGILLELPGGVLLRFSELPPVEYLRSLSSRFSEGGK